MEKQNENEQATELGGMLPSAEEMHQKASEAKERLDEERREARRQEARRQAQEILIAEVLPHMKEAATQGKFLSTVEISKTKAPMDVLQELASIVSAAGYDASILPKYSDANDYKGATFCTKW